MSKIPFVDLYAQYISIKPEIDLAIERTIRNSSYIGGSSVAEFEDSFASYLGLNNVISCANGTDSIEILLKAFGIGIGDEVIVPASSWISTSEAVSAIGATPVFVDIEENYFTIDPALIENAISPRTKAIIPVHLYGHPADMKAIMDIASRYDLFVLEDCAQAHGAMIDGQMVGTIGHAASFSFYPGKNLGAYGDAGCMVTNDSSVAEKARMIANHGQKGKHNHIIEGRNSRLDGIQASILSTKLPHLEKWTEARIRNATMYSEKLKNTSFVLPKVKDSFRHVFHLYVIRSENRDLLKYELNNAGIETAIHYPIALPFLPCYSSVGFLPSDFPVANKYQDQILSIPMFAELTSDQIDVVCSVLTKFSSTE